MQDFDFDSALTMHRAWKMKFQHGAGPRPGRGLRHAVRSAMPRNAALGRWLAANAGELSASPAVASCCRRTTSSTVSPGPSPTRSASGLILRMNDPAIVAYLDLSERIEALC
jgi:hypothetical protein